MKSAEDCIVCTTPFHIWAAICIVKNTNRETDLYIGNRFSDYKELTERVKKIGLFQNVKIYNQNLFSHEENKIKKRIEMVGIYKRIDSIMGEVCEGKNYQRVFVANNNVTCRLFYLYHIKHNVRPCVVFFDDGMGSYCLREITENSKIEKIYQYLFIGYKASKYKSSLCLFRPELYTAIYRDNFKEIQQLNQLERKPSNDTIIRNVFGDGKQTTIDKKIIVLDTYRHLEISEKGCELLEHIYGEIVDSYASDIIFKQHPKDDRFDKRLPHIENASIPFEYYCYFENMSDKIIITNISSAAFTPKLLFDQEPIVIFLYEILGNMTLLKSDINKVREYMQLSYRNPERVIVPKTEGELLDHLKRLMEL